MEPKTVPEQGVTVPDIGAPRTPLEQPDSLLKQSIFASKAYVQAIRKEKRPYKSSVVLLACILAAVLVDERAVRLLPDCGLRDYLFDITYVAKWEFFALMATGLITGIYWYYQMKYHREIEADNLGPANLSLFFSFFMLIAAIVTIFPGARGENIYIYVHLACVFFVAIGFLLNDIFTWRGMETGQAELRAQIKQQRAQIRLL